MLLYWPLFPILPVSSWVYWAIQNILNRYIILSFWYMWSWHIKHHILPRWTDESSLSINMAQFFPSTNCPLLCRRCFMHSYRESSSIGFTLNCRLTVVIRKELYTLHCAYPFSKKKITVQDNSMNSKESFGPSLHFMQEASLAFLSSESKNTHHVWQTVDHFTALQTHC